MTEAMRHLDHDQQIRRIARLLGIEPGQVADLDAVPVADLRVLHDQLSESLFVAHEESFARVASVSKVIPGAVAGKLAERFLQPALAARAAVMLEPSKAGDLVNKVSVTYLADIAVSLDPVRGQAVIRAIPPARVAEVARELLRRDELAAMAEFAGTVDKAALDAALAVATPEQLVRVAPLLAWNDNIEEIVDELADERLDAILEAVADESLWVEASVLLRRLSPETLARVAARLGRLPHIAAAIPTALVGELAVDLFETGELETMAHFVPVVPHEALATALEVAGGANLLRIAPLIEWTTAVHTIVAALTDDHLDGVLHAMAEEALWTEASVLLRRLEIDTLARVAARLAIHRTIADQIPADLIRALATDLFADDDLDTMALFVPVVSGAALTAAIEVAGAANLLRIAPLIEWSDVVLEVLEALPDSYLDSVLGEVVDQALWSEGEALVEQLDAELRGRIVTRMAAAPSELVDRIRAQVVANTSSPVLGEIVAAVDAAR
ncbi:hypothetical protein [Jatrophihabitans sp.]|uniref:hypothetical protein n=1 Tax=Jatrophihabitans sp. TaxID=1932789 RepID=UPI0030C6AEED|nr:hypothetical protein [Jatrophihabitans sp.]